ncbi:MAG: hypothetical protein OWU33_06800 [Firmicutes bacterium]|nr:hypothetical protein [Bacillota bacterium]
MVDDYESLARDFVKIDGRYGPVPLWWWDAEEVTPERIRWQMEKLRRGGIRNLCVINLAPSGPNAGSAGSAPGFYTEAWWDCWEAAVRTGERLEMFLWYYDQIGFSGANFPAQIVMEYPEYRGYHLVRWRSGESGPCPVWLQDGEWSYGIQRSGFDWLNPRAAEVLLDRIHGEMERRMGPWLGRVIAGSFQDELPPLPTWSDQLLERYRARYGDDLTSKIHELFPHPDGTPMTSKVRRQVYTLLGEMAEEAFFRPLGEWHARHHMIVGCDQAGPGREVDPYGAQRLYLDYPRTHRWFQAPGNDPDGEIKMHASIAHQSHAPRVWLEAFHSSGWGGTLEDTLHWLLPWFQAGATLYNPHAIYFSTMGGWWEWAAPDTGWRQPFFEHYSLFADGIARLSKVLSQGRHVADIAVYYPGHPLWESMAWPNGPTIGHPMQLATQDPDSRVAHIRTQFWNLVGRQNRHQPLLGALRQAGWDFDTVDDGALSRAVVDGNRLIVGDEVYQVLIFPGTEAVDDENRERIQRWINQGGIAISLGVSPDEQVFEGVRRLASASAVADELARVVSRRVKGPGQSLIRQIDDNTTLFFVMPPEGTLAPMHEVVSPSALPPESVEYWFGIQGVPELWDPWTGSRELLDYTLVDQGIHVCIPLTRWPAALVVVRGANAPPRAKKIDGPQPYHYSANGKETRTQEMRLSDDGWTVRVEPTLDNHYRDFDRHWAEAKAGVEIRRVEIAMDDEDHGIAREWWRPDSQEAVPWQSRLWIEATAWWIEDENNRSQRIPVIYSTIFGDLSYRTWAGRMGRVPRAFINLGSIPVGNRRRAYSFVEIPTSDRYWLHVEGNGIKTIFVDRMLVMKRAMNYACRAPVTLEAGWHRVDLEVEAVSSGLLRMGISLSVESPVGYPEWLKGGEESQTYNAHMTLPETFRTAALHFVVVEGVAELSINGRRVAHLGDYMPYRKWGQQAFDATPWLGVGENLLTVRWIENRESARAFLDGMWSDSVGKRHCWDIHWRDEFGGPAMPVLEPTEDYWLIPRPHLLPHVGWLEPDAVSNDRLMWVGDPNNVRKPVWIRAVLPVGAQRLRLAVAGRVTAWVDGQQVEIHHNAITLTAGPAGRLLVLRVVPEGSLMEAAVLRAPILVETSAAEGSLGNWRDVLHLPTFSGVVEYERIVEGNGQTALLHLGHVRGTAQVWVDGWDAGVRLWHPYQFDVTPAWGPGRHLIRIRVTNTLGAYYSDGKPTALCPEPQSESGLMGPVRIFEAK